MILFAIQSEFGRMKTRLPKDPNNPREWGQSIQSNTILELYLQKYQFFDNKQEKKTSDADLLHFESGNNLQSMSSEFSISTSFHIN
jgi:hypothetical protein